MARGWESKSIEAQQDEASRPKVVRAELSPEQQAIEERRRMLTLTRSRALADLERASAAPHRRMLEQAIAALDEQLAELLG